MDLIKQNDWTTDKISSRVDELMNLGYFHSSKDKCIAACEWIAIQGQEQWLWFLTAYNWGYGELPLQIMIETFECDFAVAKSIFWWSEFSFYWENDQRWAEYVGASGSKILQFIIERETITGFQHSNLRRLEWAGNNTDRLIAESFHSTKLLEAPRIPGSLIDLSDLPNTRRASDFANLNVGSTWQFRELGSQFWDHGAP